MSVGLSAESWNAGLLWLVSQLELNSMQHSEQSSVCSLLVFYNHLDESTAAVLFFRNVCGV